jgi:hypothetical protein
VSGPKRDGKFQILKKQQKKLNVYTYNKVWINNNFSTRSTPQPKVAKCRRRMETIKRFSGIKCETSNKVIAPHQNTINPACAT